MQTYQSLTSSGIPREKQWKVCDDSVVEMFTQIVSQQFFNGDTQLTKQFLACFETAHKDIKYNRNVVISGGTVVAAYQAWLDRKTLDQVAKEARQARESLNPNDLDIFYQDDLFEDERHIQRIKQMLTNSTTYKELKGGDCMSDYGNNDTNTKSDRSKRICVDSRTTAYLQMKRIKKITNYFNDQTQHIQFIQTEYKSVRSHIRTFDLSCCQMFYMGSGQGGKIYIREKYAELTAQKCMDLCWDRDLTKDTKYANRIRKYIQRGWTPVTTYQIHLNTSSADIKEKIQICTPKEPTILFQIVHPLDSLKTVDKYVQSALSKHASINDIVLAISCWVSAVQLWRHETQIANTYKAPLDSYLRMLCDIIKEHQVLFTHHVQGSELRVVHKLVHSMCKIQDRRWMLLAFMEYSDVPVVRQCFTDELLANAEHADLPFARDHLYMIKSIMATTTTVV